MKKVKQIFSNRQHMNNEQFEVFLYSNAYEESVDVHHHDFYEIYFFLDGSLDYSIENKKYHLISGDILFVNPLELHHPQATQDQQVCERIVMWINKKFLDNLASHYASLTTCFDFSLPTHSNLLRLPPSYREKITPLLASLLQESSSNNYANDAMSFAYFMQLIVELNRFSLLQKENNATVKSKSPAIIEALNYINENYQKDLSLDFIANKFFIDKYYLSHEFKSLTGTSLYKYILKKRLIYSKQMLTENIAPTKVCQKCGFSDYANFYRAFKKTYGISPKEYRKMTQDSLL
ncbi:MAG: AraC family transcriptional regulator [Anaerorhabdus sp.]